MGTFLLMNAPTDYVQIPRLGDVLPSCLGHLHNRCEDPDQFLG